MVAKSKWDKLAEVEQSKGMSVPEILAPAWFTTKDYCEKRGIKRKAAETRLCKLVDDGVLETRIALTRLRAHLYPQNVRVYRLKK